MSKNVSILTGITLIICLTAFLTGCSGGGSSAQSGTLVDPAPAYKGATTKAVPSEANAEALAMGGFGSTDIAATMRSVTKTADSGAPEATAFPPVLQLAQILKQSIRRMDLPHKASLSRAAAPSAPLAKTVGRPSNYQIPGENGGTASYSMEVNDATGNFYGTVVYQDFTTNAVVVNGTTQILGTFDTNLQSLRNLTLSFQSLTLYPATRNNGVAIITLTGSMAWALNASLTTETLAMNLVQANPAAGKTYWFKNYDLVTSYTGNGITQTISGRYYDHDHGYVDLTTQTPLYTDQGVQYPSQGTLDFTGEAGRWVRLNFLASTLQIEADTDGNNIADWQVERPNNPTPLYGPYSISGTVTGGTSGLQGVTVTLGSTATVSTDATGNYTFSGLMDGTYVITPTMSGYTFMPSSVVVTVAGSNVSGQIFTATRTQYTFEKMVGPTIWTNLQNTIAIDSLERVYVTSGSTIYRVDANGPSMYLNGAAIAAAIGGGATASSLDIPSIDVGPDDKLYLLDHNHKKILVSDGPGSVHVHRDLSDIFGFPRLIGVLDADNILLMNLYDGLWTVKNSGNSLLYDHTLVLGGTNCGTESFSVNYDGHFAYLPGCNGSPMVGGKADGTGVGILLTNGIDVGLSGWWNFSGTGRRPTGGYIVNIGGARLAHVSTAGNYELVHTQPELDALGQSMEGNNDAFYYSQVAEGPSGNIYIISRTTLYVAKKSL